MDKENLDIRQVLFDFGHQAPDIEHSDMQQQILSALLMMFLGLVLTLVGFVVVLIKLGRLANCRLLLLARSIGVIRRVTPEAGRSNLQNICTEYYSLSQTYPADHLKHQKINYSVRNFIQRKRFSAHRAS